MEGGKDVRQSIVLHVGVHRDITKEGFDLSEVFSMELSTYLSLFEHSESLIDPEVLPVLAGDIIAGP